MMKKRGKLIFSITLALAMLATMLPVAFADGPNRGYCKEIAQFRYEGTVEFVPVYVGSNGLHAIQGYVHFNADMKGDTGRQFSARARTSYDTQLYSYTALFFDSINIFAPKTRFNYGHIYVGNVGILREKTAAPNK